MARYAYIDNLASRGDNTCMMSTTFLRNMPFANLRCDLIVDYFTMGVVSILEVGLGIIAASLASCKPLVQKFFNAPLPIRLRGLADNLEEGNSIQGSSSQKQSKDTIRLSDTNV